MSNIFMEENDSTFGVPRSQISIRVHFQLEKEYIIWKWKKLGDKTSGTPFFDHESEAFHSKFSVLLYKLVICSVNS